MGLMDREKEERRIKKKALSRVKRGEDEGINSFLDRVSNQFNKVKKQERRKKDKEDFVKFKRGF